VIKIPCGENVNISAVVHVRGETESSLGYRSGPRDLSPAVCPRIYGQSCSVNTQRHIVYTFSTLSGVSTRDLTSTVGFCSSPRVLLSHLNQLNPQQFGTAPPCMLCTNSSPSQLHLLVSCLLPTRLQSPSTPVPIPKVTSKNASSVCMILDPEYIKGKKEGRLQYLGTALAGYRRIENARDDETVQSRA
jgi:hypothetical protein